MATTTTREPLSVTLQFLTLASLVWIGSSLARADPPPAATPQPESAGIEHLTRTLASLDRAIAALGGHAAPLDATPGPATQALPSATAVAAVAPPEGAGLHREIAEIRTLLMGATHAMVAAGDLSAIAQSAHAAADNLHKMQLRLGGKKDEPQRRRAKKDLLLSSQARILQRFGKPDRIDIDFTACFETWTYNSDADRSRLLTLNFRDGHVFDAN
jgi:hypothetical protein